MKKEQINGSAKGNKRKLTNKEIEKILRKEVVNQAGEEHKAGPKTEEGKRRALENLRPQAPADIEYEQLPETVNVSNQFLSVFKILNEEEMQFFKQRWFEYLEQYEMNSSADEGLLRLVIMCELALDRLFKNQLYGDFSSDKISDQIHKISKTYKDSLQELGATRKARLGAKGGKEDNIATLISNFENIKMDYSTKKETYDTEDASLMEKKRLEFLKDLECVDNLDVREDESAEAIEEDFRKYMENKFSAKEKADAVSEKKKDIWDDLTAKRRLGK